jgi:hypothetical protein
MTAAKLNVIHKHRVEPPKALSGPGLEMWRRIVDTYGFDDPAGQEALWQVCSAESRRDQVARAIIADGGKCSAHLLKAELALQSFIVRSLEKLGLEPVKAPGRPPVGGLGVTGIAAWDK